MELKIQIWNNMNTARETIILLIFVPIQSYLKHISRGHELKLFDYPYKLHVLFSKTFSIILLFQCLQMFVRRPCGTET